MCRANSQHDINSRVNYGKVLEEEYNNAEKQTNKQTRSTKNYITERLDCER
jgi:hypothetical protein